MNFLWCSSYYISNSLFDAVGLIMIISILALFVLLYIKCAGIVNKYVKNKALKYFLYFLIVLILAILFLYLVAFILMYSNTFIIKDNDNWIMGGKIGGSYESHKDYFGFHYLVMSISLLLNFIWIYYSVFKIKLSKLKDELILKTKKKKGILIFLLINILCIGFFCGTYLILDKVAPKYDYYSSNCGSD